MEIIKKEYAVVFWADSYKLGLTYHFAKLIPYLYKACPDDIDMFIVSHNSEQNVNLWNNLEHKIPPNIIIKYIDWESPECIDELCLNILIKYKKTLFHIHGQLQLKYLIPLKKRFRNKIKILIWVHSFRNGSGFIQRFIASSILSIMYRKWVDQVIYLSPFAWRTFSGGSFNINKNGAMFLPLSVEKFNNIITPSSDDLPYSLNEILSSKNIFKVVYLATFNKNKGHRWLLEGCIPVLKEHSNVRLIFLGDGPLKKNIEKLALFNKVENQVLCPGRIHRDFVPWVLQQCNVALAGTGSENVGHNAIEPYLAGIPVIGTRVGSAEYLIQDFNTGIGIGHKNLKQLTNALSFSVENPQLLYEMGNRGKSICEILFTHEYVSSALFQIYRVVLNE